MKDFHAYALLAIAVLFGAWRIYLGATAHGPVTRYNLEQAQAEHEARWDR